MKNYSPKRSKDRCDLTNGEKYNVEQKNHGAIHQDCLWNYGFPRRRCARRNNPRIYHIYHLTSVPRIIDSDDSNLILSLHHREWNRLENCLLWGTKVLRSIEKFPWCVRCLSLKQKFDWETCLFPLFLLYSQKSPKRFELLSNLQIYDLIRLRWWLIVTGWSSLKNQYL